MRSAAVSTSPCVSNPAASASRSRSSVTDGSVSLSVKESSPARTAAACACAWEAYARWIVTRNVGAPASDTTATEPGAQERSSASRSPDVCAGTPLTRLYDGITAPATPASIGPRKAGSSYSCSVRSDRLDDVAERSVSLPYPRKCLRAGTVFQTVGWSPRSPAQYAVARCDTRRGSSA